MGHSHAHMGGGVGCRGPLDSRCADVDRRALPIFVNAVRSIFYRQPPLLAVAVSALQGNPTVRFLRATAGKRRIRRSYRIALRLGRVVASRGCPPSAVAVAGGRDEHANRTACANLATKYTKLTEPSPMVNTESCRKRLPGGTVYAYGPTYDEYWPSGSDGWVKPPRPVAIGGLARPLRLAGSGCVARVMAKQAAEPVLEPDPTDGRVVRTAGSFLRPSSLSCARTCSHIGFGDGHIRHRCNFDDSMPACDRSS
jgi:hypothetical protein